MPNLDANAFVNADPTFMSLRQFLPEGPEHQTSLEGHLQHDNRNVHKLLGSLGGQSRKQMRVGVQASPASRPAGMLYPYLLIVHQPHLGARNQV